MHHQAPALHVVDGLYQSPEDRVSLVEITLQVPMRVAKHGELQLLAKATGRRDLNHLLQSAIGTWHAITDVQSRGARLQLVHPDGSIEPLGKLDTLEKPPFTP